MNNVVVVGQGAIGLLWYQHLLVDVSNNVSLRCSKNISQPPSVFSYTHLTNTREFVAITEATNTHIYNANIIILCVKSYHVASALNALQQQLNPHTIIILCHNGMGVIEEIPSTVKESQTILSALVTHGVKRTSAFQVTHTGDGKIDIGVICGSLSTKRQQQLFKQLANTQLNVHWQKNIQQQQWEKLAINCVINPITALNNINNGDINNTTYQQLKTDLLCEVINTAKAEGIILNKKELLAKIAHVAQLTAENCSSMRSDILAQRLTEIDYINGYIHRLGIIHSIKTPHNSALWNKIKVLENKNALTK